MVKGIFVFTACWLISSSSLMASPSGMILSSAHSVLKSEMPEKISADARAIINSILDVVGLKSNFEIRAAEIPNAAAVAYYGKRYILYNPKFIAAIDQAAGKNWGSIAILAHEIGHHLNGHTLGKSGSQPELELEADEFSGFVLRKMGASLSDAQLAMNIAGNIRASHTHPAKSDRLVAIAKGWEKAHGQMDGNGSMAKNHDIPQKTMKSEADPQLRKTASIEQHLAYDVHLAHDPEAKYYVTTRNNFVKLHGNALYVVGKLEATGESGFPLALSTDSRPLFYINKQGVLYTGKGRKIGYINHHQKG